MSDVENFFREAYINRQQVIFVDDIVLDVENTVTKQENDELEHSRATQVINFIKDISQLWTRNSLTDAMMELIKNTLQVYQNARKKGIDVRMIPKKWIEYIDIPPGHPRNAVLYIAHPAKKTTYLPAADFHRFTFEHKFSEALSLLMHLGAKQIHVEHVQGWGNEFSTKLSAGIPQANIESTVSAERKSKSLKSLLYQAELENKDEPMLPENLVWFQHEPTWQKVAEGRLNFGLKKFSLQLNYQDDYGVNSSLKAKAVKAGLELGGEFQNHENTTWSINGTF